VRSCGLHSFRRFIACGRVKWGKLTTTQISNTLLCTIANNALFYLVECPGMASEFRTVTVLLIVN
jgi:hypothetical protein